MASMSSPEKKAWNRCTIRTEKKQQDYTQAEDCNAQSMGQGQFCAITPCNKPWWLWFGGWSIPASGKTQSSHGYSPRHWDRN